jgi:hypothetical protein
LESFKLVDEWLAGRRFLSDHPLEAILDPESDTKRKAWEPHRGLSSV